MKKDSLGEYIYLDEQIELEADKIFSHYLKLYEEILGYKDMPYKGLSFDHIDHVFNLEGDIVYTADESWSYGGYQRHTFHLPLEWLYDSEWESIAIEQLNAKKVIREREAAAIIKNNKNEELKILKQLKEKYPDEAL